MDPKDWVHDISKYITEKLPFLQKYKTKIIFEKQDEDNGYIFGKVKVGEELYVPIIAKSFELLPLDVMNYKGKFLPLTEKNVEELLFDANMFSNVVDPQKVDTSVYTQSYPPHSGKYVYSSVRLLDKLEGHIAAEDQIDFHARIRDERILAGFKKTGMLRILKKAAMLNPLKRTESIKQAMAPLLRPNVIHITKLANGNYKMQTTSDKYYEPYEIELTLQQVREKLGEAETKKLLRDNEYGTVYGQRPWKPVVLEADLSDTSEVGDSGKYRVQDTNFALRDGWVFNSVKKFDGGSFGGKLFTDGTCYALQEKMVGEKVERDLQGPCELGRKGLRSQSDPFAIGNTGVFINGDSCTEPITITSMVMDGGDNIRFDARTQFADNFIIELTSAVKEIKKAKGSERLYYYPITWKWAPVGTKVIELLSDKKERDFAKKAAQVKSSGGKVTQVTCSPDGSFTVSNKSGNRDCKNASRDNAKFYLMACGMDPDTADQALFIAKSNGKSTISGTKDILTLSEKLASVVSTVKKDVEAIKKLRPNLLKEAAAIDDEEVVDKVLGLNFITPENVKVFIQFLPALEDASSKLAQMLLAIRIGMKEVPEASVKMAMESMTQVIDALKALEMTQTPKPSYV